jgi:DNA-binding MarR family transcriptional regulator
MFEHCLYFNTTSLARQLEREWTLAFKPFGLTPPQAFMLRVILDKQSITGTDLAKELNITKATCSRSIDGLIKLGYVIKVQAGEDGRSYEIHPTSKAVKIRDGVNQASGEVTKRIKKIIGNDKFETTVLSLRDIGSSIK